MSSPKSINFKVKSNDTTKDTAKRFVIAQHYSDPSLFECPYDLDKVYSYWVRRDTLYVEVCEGDDAKVFDKHNYDDDEKKYPYVVCVCNKDEVIDDQGWGCFEDDFTTPTEDITYGDKRAPRVPGETRIVSSKEFHNHTTYGLKQRVKELENQKAKQDAYIEAQQKEMECLKAVRTTTFGKAQETIRELKAEKEMMEQTIEEQRVEIQDLEEEVKDLEEANDNAEEYIQELKATIMDDWKEKFGTEYEWGERDKMRVIHNGF